VAISGRSTAASQSKLRLAISIYQPKQATAGHHRPLPVHANSVIRTMVTQGDDDEVSETKESKVGSSELIQHLLNHSGSQATSSLRVLGRISFHNCPRAPRHSSAAAISRMRRHATLAAARQPSTREAAVVDFGSSAGSAACQQLLLISAYRSTAARHQSKLPGVKGHHPR
jgi:hypothetical protein